MREVLKNYLSQWNCDTLFLNKPYKGTIVHWFLFYLFSLSHSLLYQLKVCKYTFSRNNKVST